MPEIYGSGARCIINCASPLTAVCALGAGARSGPAWRGKTCRSPVSWESSPKPLPDPLKQKATGMDGSPRLLGGVNQCVRTCKEHVQHPHPQGWGPAAASLCPILPGASVTALVPWLSRVENTPEVKSCETVCPDLLLVPARCWEREHRALEQGSAITGVGMLSPSVTV